MRLAPNKRTCGTESASNRKVTKTLMSKRKADEEDEYDDFQCGPSVTDIVRTNALRYQEEERKKQKKRKKKSWQLAKKFAAFEAATKWIEHDEHQW